MTDQDKISEDKMKEPAVAEINNKQEYPPKRVVLPAMAAIYLAVFLIALDRTILGTAVPSISNQFNSFGDIAWYESGFLLPLCMLQLNFGRVYTYYSAKWVLVTLVAIFELGSIVAATAPNSAAVIVGRVITGIGGAGINAGCFIIINNLIPLQSRPKYTGGLGAVFGLASILGPLLGGYLTGITWRWCFWINVPIGGVALVVLMFTTPNIPPALKPKTTLKGRISQLDPIGFVLIAPATVCLLFALQWGGTQYPWNSGRIIALFVVAGVLGILFIAAQVWRGDKGTVPPKIVLQRSMLFACIASIGIGSILVIFAFYLPIWFQAIQGKTPQESGLALLGLFLSSVVAVMGCGIVTSMIGYYTPFLIVGSAITIIGTGLLTLWQVDAPPAQWIGFQVLLGIGLGLILQVPPIAAQTVLSKEDVAIGLSLLTFLQFFGGTIFVTVGQSLLQNKLVQGLEGKVHNLDPSIIVTQGATSIRMLVPSDQLPVLLEVYNDSIRYLWYMALALAFLTFFSSFGFEWKSVKKDGNAGQDLEKDTE